MPPKRSKTPKKAASAVLYTKNQLVFAKLKGWAPWPGRVEEVNTLASGLQYRIFFFGSHNFAFCKSEELGLFDELKDTLGKNKKAKDYQAAMKEATDTPMMPAPAFKPKPDVESEKEEEEEKDEDLQPPPKKKARVASGSSTVKAKKPRKPRTKKKKGGGGDFVTNGVYEVFPYSSHIGDEEEESDTDIPTKQTANKKKKAAKPLQIRVSGLRKPTWKQNLLKTKLSDSSEGKDKQKQEDEVEKMEVGDEVSKNDEVPKNDGVPKSDEVPKNDEEPKNEGVPKNDAKNDEVSKNDDLSKNDQSSKEKETENSENEAESEDDLDDEKSPEYSDLDTPTPKKEKTFNVSLQKAELSLLLENEKLDDTVRDQLQEKSSDDTEEVADEAEVEDDKDNSSDQENDDKPVTAETIASVVNQIPYEEAKSFFKKELDLVETVDKLQQAVPEKVVPDFKKAIRILNELKNLPYDPFMLYKNIGITKTLFQLRSYFGPEDTRRLTAKEEDLCEILRNNSHRLLLSYMDAMKAPASAKKFNRFFQAKLNRIIKAKQSVSLIELTSDPTAGDDLKVEDLKADKPKNEEQDDPDNSDEDSSSKEDDEEEDETDLEEDTVQQDTNVEDESSVSDRIPLKSIESNK